MSEEEEKDTTVVAPAAAQEDEVATAAETDGISSSPPETASTSTVAAAKEERFNHEELKEDFICYQTNKTDDAFYNAFRDGFRALKEAREGGDRPSLLDEKTATTVDGHLKHSPMHVLVNCIDPTTKPASLSSPKADNLMSKSRLSSPSTSPLIVNAFEKLCSIFEKDYGSTLRAVQYTNIRSGASDVVSSIPVQMILTRTGNASGTGEQAANVAWGGMAGSAATPSTDPSEWHHGPFCHVYIAACDDMESYRNKVRPSLQAFVSQLEASNTSTTKSTPVMGSPVANGTAQSGGNANYLIVFVPKGGERLEKMNSNSAKQEGISVSSGPVRRALASQFAKARDRIANYQQDSMDNSTHSNDSLGSTEKEVQDEDPDMPSVSRHNLSTYDKLLYKKMLKDFPNGKVCILSASSLRNYDDDGGTSIIGPGDSATMVLRHQEWNVFNRMLGAVIVNGFRDRCQRYNDELRRLDAQRAKAAQAAKNPNKEEAKTAYPAGFFAANSKNKKDPTPTTFNLGYFFLVKESLAFTYEQMQLPGEALLQYDEFSAFLPDLDDKGYKKVMKLRKKSKALNVDGGPPLHQLADAADSAGFRKRIRSEVDLTPILEIVRRYLFARAVRLLFKLERPVEVISRCESFCKQMFAVMMRGVSECNEEEKKKREIDAAKWVVQFVWDVKTTCDLYLPPRDVEAKSNITSSDTVSIDTGSDLSVEGSAQSDQNVASQLEELLELARLLFKRIGDLELAENNLPRKYEGTFPADMFESWKPWACPEKIDNGSRAFVKREKAASGDRLFLLDDAFTATDKYETAYFEISEAILGLSRHGRRRRLAFRLQAELAEYLIRQGDLKAAGAILKTIVKMYRYDQWDRCHFWCLFRLSYCQRSTATPTDYLKTLATCFSQRTAAIAPKKALEALQSDLELVLGHPVINESKYGTIAFLETAMGIADTSADTFKMGAGTEGKKLLKRYCHVGESVTVDVTLTSHLPRETELDSLKLFVVEFATFSQIVENRESVEEEDSFKTLILGKGAKLAPGENSFKLEWAPASAGQFILSTIEVVWKQGFFYYDTMELAVPLLGIDVLPSEPTHSLRFDPPYLVPGHDQELKITFDSGGDYVTAGMLQLACSEEITMITPGEDPNDSEWLNECDVNLGSFKPGEQRSVTTHVRCAVLERFSKDAITQVPSFDTAHGLRATIFTKYLHAAAEESDHSGVHQMKNVSEAVVPILEKTALSVESVDPVWIVQGERLLLVVGLMSNTPDHFTIVDWNLQLPVPLKVSTDVDYNEDIHNATVSDGDELSLTFACSVMKGSKNDDACEPKLHVKLCDDNKKTVTLELPLDINEFYLELLQSGNVKRIGRAKASLKLSAKEGPIGEPIKLTFSVETEVEGDIVYSIVPGNSAWLLAGKVNGSMERTGFMSLGFMGTCEVMAVPTAPGVLGSFPTIELGLVSLKGGYTPLQMMWTGRPDSFRSIGTTSEVGVAFPTSRIAV